MCTLVPRLWISYSAIKYDLKRDITMIFINQIAVCFLGYLTLILFLRKRREIVTFLKSDASLAPKFRRFDLIFPIFFLGPIVFHYIPLLSAKFSFELYEKKFLGSIFAFCPILQMIMSHLVLISTLTWFQLAPLCAILYSLGYSILFVYKVNTLTSISENFNSTQYKCILLKLTSVSVKQEQFESIFGPFLFICLCYNFLSTVYLIFVLQVIFLNRSLHLSSFAASCLCIQAICIAFIFFISIYNEKLKKLSMRISSQLELNLIDNCPAHFWVVSYLQNRITSCINEPLTAWKMVTVDRQVILTIATSCVTFSVLFIQINNGSLIN